MKLYVIKTSLGKFRLIFHFGLGLVGKGIYKYLSPYIVDEENITLQWNTNSIESEFRLINEHLKTDTFKYEQVHIIWSAGKGGFNMIEEETNLEFDYFEKCLELIEKLTIEKNLNCPNSIHLLSSAGGIFESQVFVNSNSSPLPLRPYGKLKLRMEDYLLNKTQFNYKYIYRLSSVYSKSNFKDRKGLIAVLIQNSLMGKTTNIFGNESTLRNYVLDEDIGRFIAEKIQSSSSPGPDRESIMHLIDNKHYSIFEIKNFIEWSVKRKILIRYTKNRNNSKHITFSHNLRPKAFSTSNLCTNITVMYEKILNTFRYD